MKNIPYLNQLVSTVAIRGLVLVVLGLLVIVGRR